MEHRFQVPIMVAALLVIPVIVIEESSFGSPWRDIGMALNWGIWLAFLSEVVTMLYVVSDRTEWARHHKLDIAIVLLTPPFLTVLAGARLLRLLRLVRLLKVATLARVLFSGQGLRYAAILAGLTAVAGGIAFAAVEEGQSAGDGVYWALTTMTTVGYGDLAPATVVGKILTVTVMIVGIGFVALLTGAIAQRFLSPEIEQEAAEGEDAGVTDAEVINELRVIGTRLAQLEAAIRKPE